MTGPGETAAFAILATLIVGTGLASGIVSRTFHSVMMLGACLVSIAALYIAMGAPFIGVIQILVYVGGILTLFVFAVMFVAGDETEEEESRPVAGTGTKAAAGILLLLAAGAWLFLDYLGGFVGMFDFLGGIWLARLGALVVLAAVGVMFWRATWTQRVGGAFMLFAFPLLAAPVLAMAWPAPTGGAEVMADLTVGLFKTHVLALEILGVLLTAAMIGALVIARPLSGHHDSEHYALVSKEQLAEAQRLSDVERRMGGDR